MTAAYLYVPPSWRTVAPVAGGGALRVSFETSTCVYRRNGVWHNVMVAGQEDVSGVDVWVNPNVAGDVLLLFFTRPTPVPGALAAELGAVAKADPSWTDAQLLVLDTPAPVLIVSDSGDGSLFADLVENFDGTITSDLVSDAPDGTVTA